VRVFGVGEGENTGFRFETQGQAARIPPDLEALLAGEAPHGRIDAHVIQPFYTGLVARDAGMRVAMSIEGDQVSITAERVHQPAL
jgi:histidine phosphotransferase ChpT